jgi:hypothetical protein
MAERKEEMTPERREMFVEYGRQGGKKAAEMLGSAHMSEIGKRGRAKQLEDETSATPPRARPSSGNGRKSAKSSAQPMERTDDPLMNF